MQWWYSVHLFPSMELSRTQQLWGISSVEEKYLKLYNTITIYYWLWFTLILMIEESLNQTICLVGMKGTAHSAFIAHWRYCENYPWGKPTDRLGIDEIRSKPNDFFQIWISINIRGKTYNNRDKANWIAYEFRIIQLHWCKANASIVASDFCTSWYRIKTCWFWTHDQLPFNCYVVI